MLIAYIIVFSCIIIDQLFKYFSKKYFKFKKIKLLKDHIELMYLENDGAFLGKFSNKRTFLIIITLLSFILFAYMCTFYDLENYKLYSIGLMFVIGGTFGNFIDRLFIGHVIDFITFKFKNRYSPVFNMADFFIFGGLLALTIGALL